MLLALLVTVLAQDPRAMVKTGFYPLWEDSGSVLGHRQALLGTDTVDVGFADRFQAGLRPQELLFRTPNLHGKALLLSRPSFDLSAHAEVLCLLPGATSVFTSSNFVSRLDNARGSLWVVPVGATLSWFAADFVTLHTTASVMSVGGAAQPLYASLGLSSVLEVRPVRRLALFLHAAEIGFWRHDLAIFGASARLDLAWFYAQAGFFYRVSPDGRQSSPLLALGVAL